MRFSNCIRSTLVVSALLALAAPAVAQTQEPAEPVTSSVVSPTFFPDMNEITGHETEWTLSVPGAVDNGHYTATRINWIPIGKPPYSKWKVKLECEQGDPVTHKYELYDDTGEASIVYGVMSVKLKKHGSVAMLTTEPMTVTVNGASPMCANGSPWIDFGSSNE